MAAEELAALPWPTVGAGLKRIVVDGGDQTNIDVVLADITGSFARTYGLTGSTLLLIRPDGYIGSIATTTMSRATMAHAAAMIPAAPRQPTCCTR